MFFAAAMLIFVFIGWPRTGLRSRLDDPAYYYSRSHGPIGLGIGLFCGVTACASAWSSGDALGKLITTCLLISVLTMLVTTYRARRYMKKELSTFEQWRQARKSLTRRRGGR